MKKVYTYALVLLSICCNCAYAQVTLVSETFNFGVPSTWTLVNSSLGGDLSLGGLGPIGAAWTLQDDGYTYFSNYLSGTFHSNDASRFLLSNSDAQGDDNPPPLTNTIIQLPAFSTVSFASVSLQFYHSFFSAGESDTAMVEASLDGVAWTRVYLAAPPAPVPDTFTIGAPDNFVLQTVNLDAYGNQPLVFLRFHYISSWGYYWAIDNVTVTASGSVVPVRLLNFSGYRTGNKNLLTWSTSSEANNRGFGVERSVDGVNFIQIGFVNSMAISGNSSNTLRYNFEDASAGPGKYFYRLRQVDIDGRTTLSNIIHIDGPLPSTLSITSVFPVPVQDRLNVMLATPVNESLSVSVIGLKGEILQHQKIYVSRGANTLFVNTGMLHAGTYFLRIYSDQKKEAYLQKFVKL